ncbi:MAG TPA: diguanylate cyclase [Coleofasciculaceae cyanobacterium]|jgi:diguanylate cyclase (GGDEF)-like protein
MGERILQFEMTQQRDLHRSAKILIVDDCLDNLELLSTILIIHGYEIEQTNHGNLVLETAKVKSPDLILMDISMPEMDGFQVCQRLKAEPDTQDIPIIFISALTETNNKIKAFEYGGNDYITKPFQVEEVIARVSNQLQINRLKLELKAKNARLEQELLKRQSIEKELLNLNQQLSKLAALDGLTQIANRRVFDECLTREWQRGQREKATLSLILCDVDYFKLYNDSFGHQAGDLCLKKVAQAILNTVNRPADLVARYGGEEFAIILPQTPAKNALQVAETIRFQVKQLYLSHPESLVNNYISLSLGVTCIVPQAKYSKKQLLVAADKALYQAKKQGRDRAILTIID